MKTLEGISVLLVYLMYALIPLNIYGILELFLTRTKPGQRFERWLLKRLGIDPDIK